MSSLREPISEVGEILDLVPTIVWVTDPDGEFTYINEFGSERLGVDKTAKVSLLDCVEPADRRRAEAQWSGLQSRADGWSSEFRLRCAGEETRRMMVTSRAVLGPTGAVTGWVGACTDVEDERAAGDALRRSTIDMGLLLAEASDAARRERLRLSVAAGDSVIVPLEHATRDLALSLASLRRLLGAD